MPTMQQALLYPSGGISPGAPGVAGVVGGAPTPSINSPAQEGMGLGNFANDMTSTNANIGSLLGSVAGKVLGFSNPVGLVASLVGRAIGAYGGFGEDDAAAPGSSDVGGEGPAGGPGDPGASDVGGEGSPGGPGADSSGGDGSSDAGGEGWYHGGYVPRDKIVGNNPAGPDEGYIPIQAGEFVLPRSAVQALGPQRLKMLQAMVG